MTLTDINIAYIRHGFSKMKNKKDFLALLNFAKSLIIGDKTMPFELHQITYYANLKNTNSDNYIGFLIRKKSGRNRRIDAPNEYLKLIQRCLNVVLQCQFNPHQSATGFLSNKSIVDNARVHTGNNYVYNIDLKDFFSSIEQSRIENSLKKKPFNLNGEKELIAKLITGLCCKQTIFYEIIKLGSDNIESGEPKSVKSVLPQGAPTSPILSNIVAYSLDVKLNSLSKRFKLHYTRYADDMTFSSMHNVYNNDSEFIKELNRIITDEKFTINEKKIRLQENSIHRQVVTGLVVNDKVNIKRHYFKKIRSWLYLWETYGYEKANLYFLRDYRYDKGHVKSGNPNFSNVVLGKLNFLKMVIGSDDKRYKRLKENYDKLNEDYKKDKKENIPTVIVEKNQLPYNPKDTLKFLQLFSDNNGFKFLVHDFDNSEEDFSIHTILPNALKEYNKIKKELHIPETLLRRFYEFAFDKRPNWFTWEKGKKVRIRLGWSSKKLIDWCNNPLNKDIHPFKNAYFLENMILPFKHCIEIRKGKLEQLFNQVIEDKLKGKFDIKFINLEKASFLTDVNVFQSGLMYLFAPFQEIADNNKEYKIEISFKREIVNNHRLKIITITHINSMPKKHSDDEDLIKGDLKEAKERFRGLCNWSIEAKFEDEDNEGFKRVNVLNDNSNIPRIESIAKTEIGFTHIISFY